LEATLLVIFSGRETDASLQKDVPVTPLVVALLTDQHDVLASPDTIPERVDGRLRLTAPDEVLAVPLREVDVLPGGVVGTLLAHPLHLQRRRRRRHALPVAGSVYTRAAYSKIVNDSILDTLGSPLVRVGSPAGTTIAAKVESFNPGGSAKDRPALSMVEAAEEAGDLEAGDVIVEPTSGNTGIGLAMVGAAKGYDVRLIMPDSKSPERREIMRAYGADLELVEGEIRDARERADELDAREGFVQMRQFENSSNPDAHYRTTGVELIEQVGVRTVDALVAGVGTGGTLTGTGRRLREEFPDVDVVAVEPEDNPVLSTGEPGSDDFQGMGPGFVSDNLDVDLIDSVETVALEPAEAECRRLAGEEGIFIGQSSGASLLAAKRVAQRLRTDLDREPLVVTVFWDSGERYMSTGMFDTE
jgi:cysteine synthase A